MILRALGRLVLVPLGLVLGGAAAALAAGLLGMEKIRVAMGGKEGGAETVAAYWDLIAQGHVLLAGLTLLPALAVVLIGEIARIRSWLYYMIGGGLALGLLPLMVRAGSAPIETLPPAALWQVLATAGFVGGLVYWLVAGRNA